MSTRTKARPAGADEVRLPKEIVEHEIQTVALADIKNAEYNPRTITAKAREGLRASLRRFGNVQTVVINKRTGNLVGGHQRVALMREAGETHTRAIIVDLPPKEERALNVALNSTKITGQFDEERLTEILTEIQDDDPDLFRDLNLDDLLAIPDLGDDLDSPTDDEPKEKPELHPVISYQIVFDTEEQQEKWYDLLVQLRSWYPHLETNGARIAKYAEEALVAAKEPA